MLHNMRCHDPAVDRRGALGAICGAMENVANQLEAHLASKLLQWHAHLWHLWHVHRQTGTPEAF